MQLLARAAQTLAAADEPEAALDRVLDGVARDLGPIATIERGEGTLAVTWHDGVHGEDRDTFAEALAAIANLAHRSHGAENDRVLDAAGFRGAVDRVSAGARWRGARMAVTVFQVEGMVLGPGVGRVEAGRAGRAGRPHVRPRRRRRRPPRARPSSRCCSRAPARSRHDRPTAASATP